MAKASTTPPRTIAGVNLSGPAQDKLVARALEIGDEYGHCSDMETMLQDMGFDIPSNVKTLRITLDVDMSDLPRTIDDPWSMVDDNLDFDFSIGCVDSVEVVSVAIV